MNPYDFDYAIMSNMHYVIGISLCIGLIVLGLCAALNIGKQWGQDE